MYEVQMRYMNDNNPDIFSFTCEKYDIDNSCYRFENIVMENFILMDLEVNNEDIAVIKIK